MKRRKRTPPPYTMDLPCVMLVVDPGSKCNSGVSLWVHGEPERWGVVDVRDVLEPMAWCQAAIETGAKNDLHVVLVTERWGAGGPIGQAAMGTLIGARMMWETLAQKAGIAKCRCVRLHTATWRGAVFRRPMLTTEDAKRMARRHANLRYGIRLDEGEHDIAESIAIGTCAARSRIVGATLPKRYLVRQGFAEAAA